LRTGENEEKESEGKSEILLRVGDVMVQEVITIDENATVKGADEVMNKFEIGCLIQSGRQSCRHNNRKRLAEEVVARLKT
jgi:CBS domain-containing protein